MKLPGGRLAVAATADTSDATSASNNISNQLDLFAPGIDITTSDSDGGFSSATGTSMAAPHVAGAWAVIKHASPSISVANAENLLKTNGPNVTQNTVTRRRLNLTAALSQLPAQPTAPNEDNICFPVKLPNSNVGLICL